jgi:hypothetical protein
MSRGLGRVENHIVSEIAKHEQPDRFGRVGKTPLCITSWEVAWAYHPGYATSDGAWGWTPTRAQRKAAIRAMHSFVRKFPRFGLIGGQGRAMLYLYDTTDPKSLHFARCKAFNKTRKFVCWRDAEKTYHAAGQD